MDMGRALLCYPCDDYPSVEYNSILPTTNPHALLIPIWKFLSIRHHRILALECIRVQANK